MAGVKGKSGGPRPGSGRPPAVPTHSRAKAYQTDSADEFLRALMRDPKMPMKDRMAAALALKKDGKGEAPQGKKAQQQADAEAVVQRSLAPVKAPGRGNLRVVK